MNKIIAVNGEHVRVEPGVSIIEVEPGVFSATAGTHQHLVRMSGNTVLIDGFTFEVEVIDPRAYRRNDATAGLHGRVRLNASMPGKVVRVLAADGDHVEAGQGIVVLEAMKMQNELRSPKSGRIVRLPVAGLAVVNTGDLLAEVE